MRNIALKLMYDGTNYHGWQRQKTEITVQEALEKALKSVVGHEVSVVGCGRTDAGVHALTYCANFKTDSAIPAERLPLAVNSRLPEDVVVRAANDVDEDFNAVLSCIKKEYTYQLFNSRIKNPFYANRAYFYPMHMNHERMRAAAAQFVGTHDFAAVRSVGTDVKSTVRTIYWCDVIEHEDEMTEIRICANGFLYNMARAITGTILYVSEGKIAAEDIPALLEKGDRRATGPTVPPQGLYMTGIWYGGAAGSIFE